MGKKDKPKLIVLRFRAANRDTFGAILDGSKKIETRAATIKYRGLKAGDIAVLSCGKDKVTKKILKVEYFKSIGAILKKYKPEMINRKTYTAEEARRTWHSYPGYREKIKRHGLIAMRLK